MNGFCTFISFWLLIQYLRGFDGTHNANAKANILCKKPAKQPIEHGNSTQEVLTGIRRSRFDQNVAPQLSNENLAIYLNKLWRQFQPNQSLKVIYTAHQAAICCWTGLRT